jgi:hypothetical protein
LFQAHEHLWYFWQLESEKGRPQEFDNNQDDESSSEDEGDNDVRHYVALGSDNSWYMFTAKSVKSVHKNLADFGASATGEKPVEELLKEKLQVDIRKWENLGRSGSGPLSCVWSADSSIDTWAWGCQVPVLSELSTAYEVCNLTLLSVKQDMLNDILKFNRSFVVILSLTEGSFKFVR